MSPLKSILAAGALAFGTMVLAACTSPPPGSPPPSAKTQLFEAEATFTGAASMAGAYIGLPACGSAGAPKACKDPAVAANVVTGVNAAHAALTTAEPLVLGCPLAQYIGSIATPPTATCGLPVADQNAQAQALTAVTTAISALQAAIPIIQSSGG